MVFGFRRELRNHSRSSSAATRGTGQKHKPLNGQPSFATLHPRLLFHDRLATAMEDCVRTGRRLAVLCLKGAEIERLADHLPWPARATPATLESDGLTFVLYEQLGTEPMEVDATAGPGLNSPPPGIGMAVFPRDAEDPEGLCRMAAAAARGQSRPGAPPEIGHPIDLPGNSLELYYQPQIELRSGRAIGVEALARRPAKVGSAVDDFASAPAGMHAGDGFWALEQGVRDLATWRDLGCAEIQVAINLSLDQAGAPALRSKIEDLLGSASTPPGCLEIELTEQRPCLDHAAVAAALDSVRAMGVRLALDDFATGFSSLTLFSRLALDTLKIDRSFVAALSDPGAAEDAEHLIRDIIGLAHDRDLRVVAEGVEDEAQLATLERLECDVCQGYLFSAPLSGQALGTLLAAGMPSRWRADVETVRGVELQPK